MSCCTNLVPTHSSSRAAKMSINPCSSCRSRSFWAGSSPSSLRAHRSWTACLVSSDGCGVVVLKLLGPALFCFRRDVVLPEPGSAVAVGGDWPGLGGACCWWSGPCRGLPAFGYLTADELLAAGPALTAAALLVVDSSPTARRLTVTLPM